MFALLEFPTFMAWWCDLDGISPWVSHRQSGTTGHLHLRFPGPNLHFDLLPVGRIDQAGPRRGHAIEGDQTIPDVTSCVGGKPPDVPHKTGLFVEPGGWFLEDHLKDLIYWFCAV